MINSAKDKLVKYDELLICEDDFSSSKKWVIEKHPDSKVKFADNRMEILSPYGTTVWYKTKIYAPVMIEYYVEMIDEDGKYDRISDLNSFFLAEDKKNPDNLFALSAKRKQAELRNYNDLNMYYAGYGAHGNTVCRMRRLRGDGKRPMLPEHDIPGAVNVANKKVKVNISMLDGNYILKVDDKIIFDWQDYEPQTQGWFGFRTYASHMYISDFKVYAF